MLNRRKLLLISVAPLALAACGGGVTPAPAPVPDPWVQYVEAVLNGLQNLASLLSTLGIQIPATASGYIQQAIALARQALAAIGQAGSGVTLQSLLHYVMMAVNALASIPFLPPQVTLIIDALQVVIPVLAGILGVTLLPHSMTRRLANAPMSLTGAMRVLRSQP